MHRTATLYVLGTPVPQPRPRMTKKGRAYNPSTADLWKSNVRAAWTEAAELPFANGLRLRLEFVMARPASHLTANGNGLRASAPPRHISKPDVDNLAKAVMDALENAGAYPNDCAVEDLRTSKRYALRGEVSGCRVTLSDVDA